MTRYDAFQIDFFMWLCKYFRDTSAHVSSLNLAGKYDIPENHIQELLIRWAEEHLLLLEAYDGTCLLPWSAWPDSNSFFHNSTDHGYVRMRLLADGAQWIETAELQQRAESEPEPPRRKIGFGS